VANVIGVIKVAERKNKVMVAYPNRLRMSVEEYLELDRSSLDTKYEYIDGEVYMMAGGSPAHARIAAILIREIGFHLRGGPCDVYTSDAKVRVLGTQQYVHPDVIVSCDERDRQLEVEMLEYPCLVIEVLSPSTERIDRHKKSNLYRAMPSIQEYVLVDTQEQAVEVYRRVQNGFWWFSYFGPGDRVELASLGVTIPIEVIYEHVTFSTE
jgi:Uma2 family endonuclease